MSKVSNANAAPKAVVAVNLGGLNGSLIYTATGKVARAAQNIERHQLLNGKTVKEAIATRVVAPLDIKYDVAKGYVTLENA